jgi:hypothetical protein
MMRVTAACRARAKNTMRAAATAKLTPPMAPMR